MMEKSPNYLLQYFEPFNTVCRKHLAISLCGRWNPTCELLQYFMFFQWEMNHIDEIKENYFPAEHYSLL